jgi:uncharacterized protein (TIGR00661 family)
MRYIFIIQGEGRGHMTQAITLRNILVQQGHQVVEVLVGTSPNRIIPSFFEQKIQTKINTFQSPNFSPTPKSKRHSTTKSILFNLPRLRLYMKSIRFIKERIDFNQPDRVINFYEVLGGLTYYFYKIATPMICIAHQYILMHNDFRFPNKSKSEIAGLLFFTRLTCLGAKKVLALSFGNFTNFNDGVFEVVPPLLREEVINAKASKGDFILGYLLNPQFETEIRSWHEQNAEHSLRFFWDNKHVSEEITQVDSTLSFHKLNDVEFINSMKSCKAYATTGGFESICEALYLQKPVLMVPAHIEQECNVVDAMNVHAGVSHTEFDLMKLIQYTPYYRPNHYFKDWTLTAEATFTDLLTQPIDLFSKIDRHYSFICVKALFNPSMYVKDESLLLESVTKSESGYDVSLVNT